MIRSRICILRSIMLLLLLLWGGSGELFAVKTIELKWSALASVIGGRQVELTLPDGTVLKGKVLEVLPNSMILDIAKSSGGKFFPKGKTEVPRAQVLVINLISSNASKGAAIGALVGIPLGIANGKLQGASAGIGTSAALIGVGGLIGWGIRHATTIKILLD